MNFLLVPKRKKLQKHCNGDIFPNFQFTVFKTPPYGGFSCSTKNKAINKRHLRRVVVYMALNRTNWELSLWIYHT